MPPTEGQLRKAEGQRQVAANEPEWREIALGYLEDFATTHAVFGADDFRLHCKQTTLGKPHHQNMWGGLFTTAHNRGWIEPSGRHEVSKLPDARAHAYIIWRSLLFVAPAEVQAAEQAADAAEVPPGIELLEPEAIRYEMRADGKPGTTVKGKRALFAPRNITIYCTKHGVARSAVKFYIYVPVRIAEGH